MGAWGVGSFDNDTACDWSHDLEEGDDLSLVHAAIDAVLGGNQDAHSACQALAAAEVVARLKGNWGTRDAYTEGLDAWVVAHPSVPTADLIQRASSAIDLILDGDNELAELWDDEDE